MCKMAEVSECFTIGSVVSCKTCHSKDIEGEVVAFDPSTKMLILSILLFSLKEQQQRDSGLCLQWRIYQCPHWQLHY